MRRARSLALLAALALALARAAAAQETAAGSGPAPPQPGTVEELFAANCASCHGVLGDGNGTAELDRRARSFLDGGFSYGNTVDAIVRTVTNGIPGTPMPAFGEALAEDALRALAKHVLSLGPPVREVSAEEARLHVVRRPAVIRGHLPPIHERATAHPRGLLVGTTSGLSFEYRVDDVRLLGVRQGSFVERTDWTGRGGTPLEPLGQVVHLVEGGVPRASFAWHPPGAAPAELFARFGGTWIRGRDVGLTYGLEDAEGELRARVREALSVARTREASGFRRRYEIVPQALPTGRLRLHAARPGDHDVLTTFVAGRAGGARRAWTVIQRDERRVECVGLIGPALAAGEGWWEPRLAPSTPTVLEVVTLIGTQWTPELRRSLEELDG